MVAAYFSLNFKKYNCNVLTIIVEVFYNRFTVIRGNTQKRIILSVRRFYSILLYCNLYIIS
jgi:hypothetical protein